MTYGQTTIPGRVTGVNWEYGEIRHHFPQAGGRFINANDERDKRRVIFLGDELAEMENDPERADLAKTVLEMTERIDQASAVLFADIGYALMRAKLLAQMVIDVTAATELLHQVGAVPARRDIAEAFIRRRFLETEHAARRIEENAEGHMERDDRLLTMVAPRS